MSSDKQTHVVEVVMDQLISTPGHPCEETLARKIEDAYKRLNMLSLEKNMVILGTFQQGFSVGHSACVIITCQWINRTDLQEAQMREAIKNAMPAGGRG